MAAHILRRKLNYGEDKTSIHPQDETAILLAEENTKMLAQGSIDRMHRAVLDTQNWTQNMWENSLRRQHNILLSVADSGNMHDVTLCIGELTTDVLLKTSHFLSQLTFEYSHFQTGLRFVLQLTFTQKLHGIRFAALPCSVDFPHVEYKESFDCEYQDGDTSDGGDEDLPFSMRFKFVWEVYDFLRGKLL
ncbi:MAG: hypothetical protein GY821_10065 [Gammaproteobacteria bacterium]|nr:hypothetical protein [Gammaproteobacteria bacterium]